MQSISRRSLVTAATAGAFAQIRRDRPNILFICSDQHTSGALGVNGNPIVKTPNLDRLAARGVNFTHAYSGNPVCVPGRASMMTGMFASDVGAYCNSTPFDGHVPTWGNRLRDAGYHCWATGKMDLWVGKDFGFEEEGTSHGHSQDPDITSLFRSPVCFRPKERANANGSFSERPAPDQSKADRAIRFLRDRSTSLNKPWAMYVGMTKPHPKFEAALRFRDMYPPEKMPLPDIPPGYLEQRHTAFQVMANFKNIATPVPVDRIRKARAAYYGLITELDELIGAILNELDRTGQTGNTLIIYTSDHGEMLGEHGLWLKNVLLEGATRVPLMMAGPGIAPGVTIQTPVTHADMVRTMIETGSASTAGALRGHSLLDMRSHPGYAFSESHSEGNCTGSFAIRKDHWKYIYFTADRPLLFNLKDDPGEKHNLAASPEGKPIVKQLHQILLSLVDPDKVTSAAFRKQRDVLRGLVKSQSKQEFEENLSGRLGPAQARALAEQYYA